MVQSELRIFIIVITLIPIKKFLIRIIIIIIKVIIINKV